MSEGIRNRKLNGELSYLRDLEPPTGIQTMELKSQRSLNTKLAADRPKSRQGMVYTCSYERCGHRRELLLPTGAPETDPAEVGPKIGFKVEIIYP